MQLLYQGHHLRNTWAKWNMLLYSMAIFCGAQNMLVTLSARSLALQVAGSGCDRAAGGGQALIATFSLKFCELLLPNLVVLLGVGATECSDRGRCLHLHQVLLKQFCFACRPQAGRKAKWWDIFRGNCLIRLLNYGQRHLLDFRRWETRLLSESQESLFPRCSSPWTAFGFLVRSQCCVAGEGFNPGVCTYKTFLSSCTKVCHVCFSQESCRNWGCTHV